MENQSNLEIANERQRFWAYSDCLLRGVPASDLVDRANDVLGELFALDDAASPWVMLGGEG